MRAPSQPRVRTPLGTRTLVAGALASALAVAITALTGCGIAQHQVIKANDRCIACHDANMKEADTPAASLEITSVGLELTVETSHATVSVCEPLYTDNAAVPYVPREIRSAKVVDGKATVQLEEGIWAIAVQEAGGATTSVLVEATADGSTDSLKL